MTQDPESVQIRNNLGFIEDNNPFQVQIGDGTELVDVIPTNGFNGVVAIAPGHTSTDNSTSDPLIGDAVFTGEWEDITNFGVIVLTAKASHTSATDGVCVEFSSDGANVDSADVFTLPADTGKTWSFQSATKYFRLVYTNGATEQTFFRLQVTLKPYYVKPSSHRIQDQIVDEDDAELVKAVITGEKPNGEFVNFQATAAGNFKSSIEEYDPAVDPIRKDMEGGGKISVGTSAVEVTFTGTPTHAIIITADKDNSGTLYVGESNVASDGSNAINFLERGDSIVIDYDDSENPLYVVSDTASQFFWKGATL